MERFNQFVGITVHIFSPYYTASISCFFSTFYIFTQPVTGTNNLSYRRDNARRPHRPYTVKKPDSPVYISVADSMSL